MRKFIPLSKVKVLFSCSACAAEFPKWAGQCADCGEWNSLSEIVSSGKRDSRRSGGYSGSAGRSEVTGLANIEFTQDYRWPSGIAELDRVLGGGIVAGSVVLLGGDPGIGKSTLLIQVMASLSVGSRVLYVTGEESLQQIAMRANRLSLPIDSMRCLAETSIEHILHAAVKEKPKVIVIDSIQTIFSEQLQSAPGSVSQVRETAAELVRFAKSSGCAVILVGHVTKEGALAGPRVLEHMVDAVLYFEGNVSSRYRVIRAIKNRFGAINEVGVFIMSESGLKQVSNPSAIFLSHHQQAVPGTCVMVTREGTRPLLVELQALVDQSHLGNPRRVTVGLEQNRLTMLLAVLHRHGGIPTHDQDVFVNAVGGIRVNETASDLPLLMAIISSLRNRALPSRQIAFGEIGLAGEIRPVYNGEERLKEAYSHGFKRVIIPKSNVPKGSKFSLDIVGIDRLDEALDVCFD